VPDGYHSVTPYLTVRGGAEMLAFYTRALDAREVMRMPGPGGRIMHAEMKVGNSVVMLGDEPPDKPDCRAPRSAGARTAGFYVYVRDVDAAFARAVSAGAKVVQPLQDMFWGDRIGTVEDSSGHQWTLATHKEELTPREIARRAQAAMTGGAS
jgi:PhnB protein